jgi:EAL domain-containing protein (putative c-di-GMP-specific phosphodiesterase class I)
MERRKKWISHPARFIPMAEKAGYIIDIGKWVIKEALSTFSLLKHSHGFRGVISINISTIQLKDAQFLDMLSYYTEINKVDPSDVEIEITKVCL